MLLPLLFCSSRLHHCLPFFIVGRSPALSHATAGFLSPAALEVDLSGCSYIPKSVFKQLGFSCPRIVHLNLSMCSQVRVRAV